MKNKISIIFVIYINTIFSKQIAANFIQQLPVNTNDLDKKEQIEHTRNSINSNLFTINAGFPDLFNIDYERYFGDFSIGINTGLLGFYTLRDCDKGFLFPSLIVSATIKSIKTNRNRKIHRLCFLPGLVLSGKYLSHDFNTKGFYIPLRYEFLFLRRNTVFKVGVGAMYFLFATEPNPSNPWSEGSHGAFILPTISIAWGIFTKR